MDSHTLSNSTYGSSPRLARRLKLNTIIEDASPRASLLTTHPRSRRASDVSPTSCYSRMSVSTISSYYEGSHGSEQEDLYGVSDSESELEGRAGPKINLKRASTGSSTLSTLSTSTTRSRNRYPALVIPSPRHWPTIQNYQKPSPMTLDSFCKNSPVPPTPPAKIPISPEVLSRLPAGPASSATPSLDGSLSSDRLASISAPPTPDIANAPDRVADWSRVEIARASADFNEEEGPTIEVGLDIDSFRDSGVQLPAEALDLLQHLSVEIPPSPVQAFPSETLEMVVSTDSREMQEVACILRAPVTESEPVSATSEYSMAQLSIPSPGGFFSSLDARSRETWSTNPTSLDASRPTSQEDIAPPSSTTAEHFYNAPWNRDRSAIVVEQLIDNDGETTEGPPTARYAPFSPQRTPLGGAMSTALISPPFLSPGQRAQLMSPPLLHEPMLTPPPLPPRLESHYPMWRPALPPRQQTAPAGLERQSVLSPLGLDNADRTLSLDDIDRQLRITAESALSRTTLWAAAQSDFLNTLAGKPASSSSSASTSDTEGTDPATPEVVVAKGKKAVKFLDTVRANATSAEADSLFYHAFQTLSNQSSPTDSFVHRHSRFDAIQALRASLRHTHIDALLGHYATVDRPRHATPRPISMMPRDAADPEVAAAQAAHQQRERERQAFEQVAPAMWIVEAMRFLAGGRLLNSPAAAILDRAAAPPRMGSRLPPAPAVHVLDLGGQPQCDWAWHVARHWPHVRTYTATTDEKACNLNIKGPRNHRCVRVDKLFSLPFPDAFFDVVSARSLPQFLRAVPTSSTASVASASAPIDEYDATLAEMHRVLKPGGYIEYFVLDAELAQPGPKGEAASVEFAVNLRQRGYDATPTRAWLRRVRSAGFVGIKRAWMFLPMGAIRAPETPLPETPPPPSLIDAASRTSTSTSSSARTPSSATTIASTLSSVIGSGGGGGGAQGGAPGLASPQSHASVHFSPVGALCVDFATEGPQRIEAVQGPVGSAADAAHVSGLVGSWLWERWMVRLQMEMGRDQARMLEGVGAVVQEGREGGGGWRCLSGWARKVDE